MKQEQGDAIIVGASSPAPIKGSLEDLAKGPLLEVLPAVDGVWPELRTLIKNTGITYGLWKHIRWKKSINIIFSLLLYIETTTTSATPRYTCNTLKYTTIIIIPHLVLLMEVLGVEGSKLLHNVGIRSLERRVVRSLAGLDDLGVALRRPTDRDGGRVLEMTIASTTRQDLLAGLILEQGVLVLDLLVVGLHAGEAAGDDLVVDTDDGVLGDVLYEIRQAHTG